MRLQIHHVLGKWKTGMKLQLDFTIDEAFLVGTDITLKMDTSQQIPWFKSIVRL